jgi:hypothetical protein
MDGRLTLYSWQAAPGRLGLGVVLNGTHVPDAYLVVPVHNVEALDDSSWTFAFEK